MSSSRAYSWCCTKPWCGESSSEAGSTTSAARACTRGESRLFKSLKTSERLGVVVIVPRLMAPWQILQALRTHSEDHRWIQFSCFQNGTQGHWEARCSLHLEIKVFQESHKSQTPKSKSNAGRLWSLCVHECGLVVVHRQTRAQTHTYYEK